LDEAFTEARPGLAARLQNGSLFGDGPAGVLHQALIVPVTMAEGAGKALDSAIAEKKRSGRTTVLATSPLIAKAILGSGTWSGDPPLLVPEWHGPEAPGLWTASTDPVPAYRAAGSAAGAFVAALSKEGGSPSCGVLFSEAPSRPRAALTAFASAYADASEGRPLYVRELVEDIAAGAGGSPPSKGRDAGSNSASGDAKAAATELLGSDIRVLFVALGSSSGAAIDAAARPGLAIGADFPAPEPPASLAFRILPDDLSLATALATERRALRGPDAADGLKAARGGASEAVPALLVAGASSGAIRVGKLDFAYFLSEAAKRRPAKSRQRVRMGRVARERIAIKPLAVQTI